MGRYKRYTRPSYPASGGDTMLNMEHALRDNLRYISLFRKRLGYIGWLGFGNLGDE